MSQIKAYVSKELTDYINKFADDNYTKPTEVVNAFISFVVDLLEETGAKSIPELKEKIKSPVKQDRSAPKKPASGSSGSTPSQERPNGDKAMRSI